MNSCPHCGAAYGPDDIEAELRIAMCQSCGEVSDLPAEEPEDAEEPEPPFVPEPTDEVGPDLDEWAQDTVEKALPAPRAAAELGAPPSGWSVIRGAPLGLRQRWLSPAAFPLLFFAMLWNGFLMIFVLAGEIAIIGTPHAWIGIALAYYVAASLLNTTTIQKVGEEIQVRHGPLPWFGSRTLDASQLDQLFVKLSNVRVNKQPRWNLVALMKDGREQVLVRLLANTADARWLERYLEDGLSIVDRPVDGEIPRS